MERSRGGRVVIPGGTPQPQSEQVDRNASEPDPAVAPAPGTAQPGAPPAPQSSAPSIAPRRDIPAPQENQGGATSLAADVRQQRALDEQILRTSMRIGDGPETDRSHRPHRHREEPYPQSDPVQEARAKREARFQNELTKHRADAEKKRILTEKKNEYAATHLLPTLNRDTQITPTGRRVFEHLRDGDNTAGISLEDAVRMIRRGNGIQYMGRNVDQGNVDVYSIRYSGAGSIDPEGVKTIIFSANQDGTNIKVFHIGPGGPPYPCDVSHLR